MLRGMQLTGVPDNCGDEFIFLQAFKIFKIFDFPDFHIHFFGTDCLSFSDHIRLQDGDIMQVAAEGFGRPLRNPVRSATSKPELVKVIPLR